MKGLILSALAIISFNSWAFKNHTSTVSKHTEILGYITYLPDNYSSSGPELPLIVFFHGMGEQAKGNTAILDKLDNTGLPQLLENGMDLPFIVVSPQARYSWNNTGIDKSINPFLDEIMAKYRVDKSKVFFTGLSDGGKAIFHYTYNKPSNLDRITAIVPVSTWPVSDQDVAGYKNTPIFSLMGSGDKYGALNTFTKNLKSAGGDTALHLLSGGHTSSVWNAVYDKNKQYSYNGKNTNIYDWMLSYVGDTPSGPPAEEPGNYAPSISSISNISMDEDANKSVTISSSDADGDQISLSISGLPSFASFTDQGSGKGYLSLSPKVGDAGSYTLKVIAKDSHGASSSKSFQVSVQAGDSQDNDDQVVFAVNAGGSAYNGNDGISYSADKSFSGGYAANFGSPSVADTSDDVLYRTERFGNFSYNISVPNGDYEVTLKYAEMWSGCFKSDCRIQDVFIEGKEVQSSFDVYRSAGVERKAIDKTFAASVSDGSLNIKFVTLKENAKVSAIIVRKKASTNGSVVLAVNAGGSAFTGADGVSYSSDKAFSGGYAANFGTPAVSNTSDDVLYRTERYGNSSYSFNLPNGNYTVTLKYAEMWSGCFKADCRVQDVYIEGQKVQSSFDVYAAAGVERKAVDKTFSVSVTDGYLNIRFVTLKENAKISGIVVREN